MPATFHDWVEETTNYAGAVAEAALGHVVGDKVEAAYRRGDLFEKRRKLMAAWTTYCTTPAKQEDVIPTAPGQRAVAADKVGQSGWNSLLDRKRQVRHFERMVRRHLKQPLIPRCRLVSASV